MDQSFRLEFLEDLLERRIINVSPDLDGPRPYPVVAGIVNHAVYNVLFLVHKEFISVNQVEVR